MENLQYISVVSDATREDSPELILVLESEDLSANISLTLSVSGIVGTETASQLANKIYLQLDTLLVQNNYDFDGTLYFSDQVKSAKFDINRTESVVSIFSQCAFTVSAGTNTTGAFIVIADHPVPITLNEVDRYSTVTKRTMDDSCGDTLDDDQKVDLITLASASLCAYLCNNIVQTTYLDSEVCKGTKSVFTRKYPLRDFFPPSIRRPYGLSFMMYSSYAVSPDNKSNYAIDSNRREIYYRFAQDFFEAYEPFDDGNEMMLAYKAGYTKIPTVIKQAILQFVTLIDYDPTTKSYKAEGFEHVMNNPSDVYDSMSRILGNYRIYGL